jgi:hypothetical protein
MADLLVCSLIGRRPAARLLCNPSDLAMGHALFARLFLLSLAAPLILLSRAMASDAAWKFLLTGQHRQCPQKASPRIGYDFVPYRQLIDSLWRFLRVDPDGPRLEEIASRICATRHLSNGELVVEVDRRHWRIRAKCVGAREYILSGR